MPPTVMAASRDLLVAALVGAGSLLAREDSHAEDAYIGGEYDMHGTITLKESGERRPIAGTLIVDQRGSEYRATYHLRTRVQTEDGLRHADVIGRGEGSVAGAGFQGTSETQLILARAPGAYGAVPYMPRRFGPVLHNETAGSVDEHGVLTIELDYQPGEGGPQNATHTVLRGERKKP